ncbi:MAG: GntR family transcriptional regulator, partial [Chitinispirillaceae bacterium]
TMPPGKSPALKKALEFITKSVNEEGQKKLPSIRTISRRCGVSAVTVTRAIGQLKEEGMIVSVWGKGLFTADSLPHRGTLHSDLESEKRDYKYNRILRELKKDITDGKYPTSFPLPAKKQLARGYNVSYPTINKVLSLLVKDGILKRSGSKFLFFTNRTVHRQRIMVIALGFSAEAIKIQTEREKTFYRSLSAAALNMSVDLEIISYNDYLETPRFFLPDGHTLETFIKKQKICGIILSSYHMNDSAQCLQKLICTGVPVSVWIEDRRILQSVSRYKPKYSRLTFFDSSYSSIPGRDVGKYLISKGHREIAYISPFHGSPWSQNRLEGLLKAGTSTQISWKVHPCVETKYSNDYAFMEQVFKRTPFEKDFSAAANITNKIQPFLSGRMDAMRYDYEKLRRDDLIFSCCKPLLDKAASVPTITAWVCANDLIACLIADYWDYTSVPFEKRPALVGFDNTFESLEKKISSYEFNTAGEVQSMLTHLLYPNSALFHEENSAISLRGNVIERRSSSRSL